MTASRRPSTNDQRSDVGTTRDARQCGFTLVELLIALTIVLVIAAGLALVTDDAYPMFLAQPEAADAVLRMRAALDAFTQDISMAGAGPHLGEAPGPLTRAIAAVFPQRRGMQQPDPELSAYDDRITVLFVPDRAPQTSVLGTMVSPDDVVPVKVGPGCPLGDPACGFRAGMQAIVFDDIAAFDTFAVQAVAPGVLVHHPATLSKAYAASMGGRVAGLRMTTFYYDASRRQLRRYDGEDADFPVLDEVVELTFRYFGTTFPPQRPKPPPGEANCLFDAAGTSQLAVLAPTFGTLAELTPAMLSDGPSCGAAPNRYDADLLRIRQVRIGVRLQAPSPSVRGLDPDRFRIAGTSGNARGQVPDIDVLLDVTPRNLQVP
jgi:prepilin-type N-terminal cleavage/methylation domain-containing protein